MATKIAGKTPALSHDIVRPMIVAAIRTNYENAAKAFGEKPSGENWLALQNAMWARQAIMDTDVMNATLPRLVETGIGHWVEILRAAHQDEGGI